MQIIMNSDNKESIYEVVYDENTIKYQRTLKTQNKVNK